MTSNAFKLKNSACLSGYWLLLDFSFLVENFWVQSSGFLSVHLLITTLEWLVVRKNKRKVKEGSLVLKIYFNIINSDQQRVMFQRCSWRFLRLSCVRMGRY